MNEMRNFVFLGQLLDHCGCCRLVKQVYLLLHQMLVSPVQLLSSQGNHPVASIQIMPTKIGANAAAATSNQNRIKGGTHAALPMNGKWDGPPTRPPRLH